MPRETVHITEQGMADVLDTLDRLSKYEGLREELDAALDVMFDAMRTSIPVKTGFLKSTARSGSEFDADEWTGHVVVGEGVPYLHWVYPAREPNELDHIFNASEALFDAAIRSWQAKQLL